MKKIGKILPVLVVLCVGLPQLANAVSPSPIPAEHEERIAKGIKVKGETVCLFQSGTPDVKKELAAGDILVVYRETGTHELKEHLRVRSIMFDSPRFF
jgi:hypothetical protein